MFLDRHAREFIVARLRLISAFAIDEMDNGHRRFILHPRQPQRVGIIAQIFRQFAQQAFECAAQLVAFRHHVGIEPGAARIADLLLALDRIEKIARQRPSRAEQIDLEDAHFRRRRRLVQHILQRRIGDDAAIPEIIRADPDRRQAGRQRARGQYMLELELFLGLVEESEIAGADIDGADTEPWALTIEIVEIDKLTQAADQRLGRIIAERCRPIGRHQDRRWEAGLEKSRHPEIKTEQRTRIVENGAVQPVSHQWYALQSRRHTLPEVAQPLDAVLRRIAGDDGPVDGADRNASDPIGRQSMLTKGFEGPGLIGAERPAALQDEDDFFAGFWGFFGHYPSLDRAYAAMQHGRP